MTVDASTIRARTKTKDNDELLAADVARAKALLDAYIAGDGLDPATEIPAAIYDAAHEAVAVELYTIRKGPNDSPTQQYDMGGDSAPIVRVGRDPLWSAYPLLRDYVLPVRFA